MSWTVRSTVFRTLGYPELACSDAWKAILLCNAAIEGGDHQTDAVRHHSLTIWQYSVNEEEFLSMPVDFENDDYNTWLKNAEAATNFRDQILNGLRSHQKGS
jgi:hypothetical protein